MFSNLKRISELATSKNVKAVIHPHVGTMVETEEDIMKVLEGTTIQFCLDTGHMIIGGTDPVEFAKNHSDRIGHSHLKDVDMSVAKKVRDSGMSYYDAVVAGMYKPLGQGDVDIASIVKSLVASGYDGWFALEQDNVVTEEPGLGEGPIADAKASVDFLNSVIEEINN
jgi:inosose dehydratase